MNWTSMRIYLSSNATLKVLGILLLGQIVSSAVALMSITTSLIAEFGVDTPLTQSLLTYGSLALVYGSILLYRHQKPMVSWYWYLLLGFADAQGCYLVIKAYQYSSITSVTLLDCWTVPWVILLTWIFLGTRYSLWQLFGGTLCVLGLSLVLLSDTWSGGGGGSKIILGDVLVIVGTVFYAISNVGEEFCVKKKDRVEVVAMLGVYGFLVTAVEVYGVSSFIFYSLAPFVLKLSGSTMFNLSLLTADMWAVVFRVFFYHQKVDWLYFVSFAVVGIGLTIYSTTEKKSVPAAGTTIEENENLNTEYQILNGESEGVTTST
ncbi:uncharacterized protein LOC131613088 isoform X2 [Vicia villosa]|uniref:uncharacterized protein LOC131613088 isoform X2 n=1 Tax=Vicia villosa TaxID=3911 RepID=UPI00273AFC3F|nr:uncharacterized protein LOC131613088 isoform X2 [Vicia villosa]